MYIFSYKFTMYIVCYISPFMFVYNNHIILEKTNTGVYMCCPIAGGGRLKKSV